MEHDPITFGQMDFYPYILFQFRSVRIRTFHPGDLVFYYGDVGFFNGIVRIVQFDGNMDAITSQTGDFTATIELAD